VFSSKMSKTAKTFEIKSNQAWSWSDHIWIVNTSLISRIRVLKSRQNGILERVGLLGVLTWGDSLLQDLEQLSGRLVVHDYNLDEVLWFPDESLEQFRTKEMDVRSSFSKKLEVTKKSWTIPDKRNGRSLFFLKETWSN